MAQATPAQLRVAFPEVSSEPDYPTATLSFWLDQAYGMTNAERFGTRLDLAAQLFALHHVVLEAEALKRARNRGTPGLANGITNSESVDKVSVGYDTQGGSELDAGHWNLTIYGSRYVAMARLFAAGPIQL